MNQLCSFGYEMMGSYTCLVITFLSCLIQVCCSQECFTYEDCGVHHVCPKLRIDNGTVCYNRIQDASMTNWKAMFSCNRGYDLHGSEEILCRPVNENYIWRGETPICYQLEERNERDDHLVLYIIIPGAIALAMIIILAVVCSRRKYLESMLTTRNSKYTWTDSKAPSTISTKDHMVVLPVCEIKTTTVLHNTSIHPSNRDWPVPRDTEPPVPYYEPETYPEGDEGTVTNDGYEDEDYIHGIFQRLNYTSMGGMLGYAKMSDTGVVSIPEEPSDEEEVVDMNSKKANEPQSVSSHSIQHIKVDDDTYCRLHRTGRRCSGDATYTHLYDNWLERHQSKGSIDHLHGDLPACTNSTTDDKPESGKPEFY